MARPKKGKIITLKLHALAYRVEEGKADRLIDILLDYEGKQKPLRKFIEKFKHGVRVDTVISKRYEYGQRETHVFASYWIDEEAWEFLKYK